MRSVKFIKSLPGRAVGEIAGYTDEMAERYVKAGVAEYNGVIDDVSRETKDAPLPSRARKQAKAEDDDDPDRRYRDRAQSSAKRIRETVAETGVFMPSE